LVTEVVDALVLLKSCLGISGKGSEEVAVLEGVLRRGKISAKPCGLEASVGPLSGGIIG
jgi:hypothetical protein